MRPDCPCGIEARNLELSPRRQARKEIKRVSLRLARSIWCIDCMLPCIWHHGKFRENNTEIDSRQAIIDVAAIPSASLVVIVVILAVIGLPAEGIGLIYAVDRILDMCRTSVNVLSGSCGAVTVGRLEGERGILRKTPDET
jgi:hypothetical protein